MVVGRRLVAGLAGVLVATACGGRSISTSSDETGSTSPGDDAGVPSAPTGDVIPPAPESPLCPADYIYDTGGCRWTLCSRGDYQCHRLCPKGTECRSTPCVWHEDCANDYCPTSYHACGIESQS